MNGQVKAFEDREAVAPSGIVSKELKNTRSVELSPAGSDWSVLNVMDRTFIQSSLHDKVLFCFVYPPMSFLKGGLPFSNAASGLFTNGEVKYSISKRYVKNVIRPFRLVEGSRVIL